MKLLEFQAKRLFANNGIPVPDAVLLQSPADLRGVHFPAIFKAQVVSGGRGKAGAIQVVRDPTHSVETFVSLMGMKVKDQPVLAVLAEELVDIQEEFYLSLLIDKQTCQTVFIASRRGGMDIEEVAASEPAQIYRKYIDLSAGLTDYTTRTLAKILGLQDAASLRLIIIAMVTLFQEYDATLVEINPLAVSPNGLIALDAKVTLDEKSAYRHTKFFEKLQQEQKNLDKSTKNLAVQLAEEHEITFVPLDGVIGLISDGAGTGMLSLDLIHDFGGKAANFCELGGLGDAERMCQAMEVVLAQSQVRSLLITLIGGLTRMDNMAEGIKQYLKRHQTPVPIVVRMCGTQEEAGRAILSEFGITPFDDLSTAVMEAARLAEKA